MTSKAIKVDLAAVESSNNENTHAICRLCMSEELLEDVFNEDSVRSWISNYLSIVISTEDLLSHVICAICRIRLAEFHHFRIHCHEVQSVLEAKLPKAIAKGREISHPPVKNTETQTIGYKTSSGPVQCKVCGKHFSNKKIYWNHIRIHRPKKHSCTICDKSFALRSALIRHMQYHEKQRFKNQWQTWKVKANITSESKNAHSITQHDSKSDNKLPVKIESQTEYTVNATNEANKHGSDPLQCNICQKKLLTKQRFVFHLKRVHGPKIHGCDICNLKFSIKGDLYSHFRSNSHLRKLTELPSTKIQVTTPELKVKDDTSNGVSSTCAPTHVKEIGNDFTGAIDKTHSQNGNDGQSIAIKVEELTIADEADESERRETSAATKRDEESNRRSPLQKHPSLHSDSLLECDICHKTYLYKKALTAHRNTHELAEYTCHICEQMFSSRIQLDKHLLLHGLEQATVKMFHCGICQKNFNSRLRLSEHKKQQHDARKHVCNKCGKTFVYRYQLDNHLRVHERSAKIQNEKGATIFKCGICQITRNNRHKMAEHMKSKHQMRKQVCSICGQRFVYRHQLARHLLLHERRLETQQNTHVCDICQCAFNLESLLKRHKKDVHGIKPYQCHICDSRFLWRSRLSVHLLTHDSKEFHPLQQTFDTKSNQKEKDNVQITSGTPKKCKKCPKKFQSIISLWFHKKHSHKPKYKCTMCYGAFTSSALLERHKWTKHRQADGQPMKCVPCNKVFTTTKQRTSHILKHMPRKRSCQICNKQFLSTNRLLNHVKMIHNADREKDSESNTKTTTVQNTTVEVIVKDEPVEIF